jgi:5'-3' exonuclease
VGDRVVQIDRKTRKVRDAAGVKEKFGVDAPLIPDFLALVGDSADGYPGLAGIGAVGAARLIARFGRLEDFPDSTLSQERRALALLFKTLATLRTDAPLFRSVDELQWRGPTPEFGQHAIEMADARLRGRAHSAWDARQESNDG